MATVTYPNEITKYPAWKELVDRVGTFEYGSFHTREEIAEILMAEIGTQKYSYGISMANKHLLEMGKQLDSVHGKGYIVLEPKNYSKKIISHCNRGKNCVKKAWKTAINTPTEHLTSLELNTHNQLVDNTSKLIVAYESGYKGIQTVQRHYLELNSARG